MGKISFKGASWDSVFLAFTRGLTVVLGLISAKVLSTGLTLSEYGTYSQANLVSTIGASIILLGLVDAMNYYFNNKKIDDSLRTRIVNTVFFLEIVFGVLFLIAVVCGEKLLLGFFGNDALRYLLPIAGILPVFTNITYFYQVLCVSVGRAKLMSWLDIISIISRIVAICISVYVLKSILWIYIVTLLMDVIKITIFNMVLRKNTVVINPIKISKGHIKPIINYGLPMGIYALTNSFTRDLDKLVIGRLGGTEEMAIYSNCSKFLPVDFLVSAFALVLVPYIYQRVSEGRREESIDLFSSYLKVGYYTVWIIGATILVAPESIISFLYSNSYLPGKSVFVLYIFDSMLRFASIHLILTAAGKSKNVMIYSVISLALNLILNIVFYYLFGMVGPAIATLIVAVIYMFLILNDTRKTINAKWTEIFNFKEVLLFFLTLVASWTFSFVLNKVFVFKGMNLYLSMIICMLLFATTVVLLHYKKILKVFKKINTYEL